MVLHAPIAGHARGILHGADQAALVVLPVRQASGPSCKRTNGGEGWRALRDSNPCFRRESASQRFCYRPSVSMIVFQLIELTGIMHIVCPYASSLIRPHRLDTNWTPIPCPAAQEAQNSK